MANTKAIHQMDLLEAEKLLTSYQTTLNIREVETKRHQVMIDKINDDTPDLKDCIRILKDRIKELS